MANGIFYKAFIQKAALSWCMLKPNCTKELPGSWKNRVFAITVTMGRLHFSVGVFTPGHSWKYIRSILVVPWSMPVNRVMHRIGQQLCVQAPGVKSQQVVGGNRAASGKISVECKVRAFWIRSGINTCSRGRTCPRERYFPSGKTSWRHVQDGRKVYWYVYPAPSRHRSRSTAGSTAARQKQPVDALGTVRVNNR